METYTVFQNVDAYAGDPILSLMEAFKQDPREHKVNLSIGLYYDEKGIIPQLKAVAAAEEQLHAEPHQASLYLPMEGLNSYRSAIAPLLFGVKGGPDCVDSDAGWFWRAESGRRFP
jgi:aromatic-amino-acid transaminase